MFRSGRTWISRTLIILFTSFALIISQSCYAADDDDNDDHRFGFVAFDYGVFLDTAIALAVPVAIAALAFASLTKKNEASTPAPVPCATIEVVYKDTTSVTYSYPNESHDNGKLTIKNNSNNTIQLLASITPDSAGKANIQILPSSSCLSPVAAGATCSYNFSYADNFITNGSPPSIVRAETLINVKCDASNEVLLSFPIESYFPSYYWFLSVPANITGFNKLPSNDITSVFCQDDTVYVSYYDSGIGISHDNGESWNLYTSSQGQGIPALTFTNTVYASGSTIYIGTSSSSSITGLVVSTDDGINWFAYLLEPLPKFAGGNIQGVYTLGSNVYVATQSGLFVSGNNGGLWTKYDSTTTGFAATNNVQAVYAVGDFISAATDAGISIYNKASGSWVTYVGIPTFGGSDVKGTYISGTTIYAATNNGLSIGTYNGAGGWTWVNRTGSGLGSNDVRGVYVSGGIIYAATAAGLSISNNPAGTSWNNYIKANGLGSDNIKGVSVCGSNVYAATDHGLSVGLNNGATWTAYESGGPPENFGSYDLYVIGDNIYLAKVTSPSPLSSGGLSVSHDGGLTWTSYNLSNTANFPSNLVFNVYVLGNNIYAATAGGLSVSYDNGRNWTLYNTSTVPQILSDNVLDVYAVGSNIYAATDGGLSIYNGTTWFTYTMLLNGLPSNHISAVYVTGGNIYAGTSDAGLAISLNGGGAWPKQYNSSTTDFGGNHIYDIYVVGTTIYAATDNGLSVGTYDGGSGSWTWTTYNSMTSPQFGQDTVLKVYATNDRIYAATVGGLKVSKNNGGSWDTYSTQAGLQHYSLQGLAVDSGKIYVAMYYDGIAMTKETP